MKFEPFIAVRIKYDHLSDTRRDTSIGHIFLVVCVEKRDTGTWWISGTGFSHMKESCVEAHGLKRAMHDLKTEIARGWMAVREDIDAAEKDGD